MAVQEIDDLKIYRGQDYPINDKIKIHIPTLGEICEYGESKYFSLVRALTATPSDMKWQLDVMGVDFTTIDNFTLFSQITTYHDENTPEEEYSFNKNRTSIVFEDLNLFNFVLAQDNSNGEMCLYNRETDTIIDGYVYKLIADCLRKVHFLTENIEIPANESTKRVLIEDAQDEYLRNKDKTPQSYLLNLISAMVNCEGFKYNHTEVWDMKIYAFLDSVKRITKIKNANLLLQSGYSGFGIDLKQISNKQINWQGEL